MTGLEPVTSSLPRKHSTPELHRQRTPKLLNSQKLKTLNHTSPFKEKGIHSKFLIPNLIQHSKWEEQDSNPRRFPNGFTVRARWPLEYLPGLNQLAITPPNLIYFFFKKRLIKKSSISNGLQR